ncbi:MAG: TfoX/Sxy family protein [Lysobacteraceae bacterium]
MSTPLKVGPKAVAWLRQVGVRTHEDLVEVGAVAAYVKCKRAGFRPSLNMLYALEGALLGCHWQKVPEERRAELQALAEAQIANIPPPRGRVAALTVSEVRDVVVDGEDVPAEAMDFTEGDDDSRERED